MSDGQNTLMAPPLPVHRPRRVAYLVTHPIQYQAPLLRLVAADPDIALKVFFVSDFSARHFVDPEFGRAIEWDVPLLDGYESEVLPIMPGTRYPGDSYFDFWRPFSIGLGQRLRAGKFDTLWIHGYARAAHMKAMATARYSGCKVLLRDEVTDVGRVRTGWKSDVRRWGFKAIDRMVDAYLTCGTLNEQCYRDLGIDPAKFHRVGYTVDNAWFQARIADAAPHREALRAELGVAPGRPIALYAAKLIARKAPGELLDAFALATKDSAPGAGPALLMAGDGELKAEVEARIARHGLGERVKLLGFQPQQKLAALYELCDLFVLPSAHETWGLVVNEVMNAGRAVIASDRVGSARDLIREDVNGYVYPFGDTAALGERLRSALADPQKLAAMGRESRAMIDRWSFAENLAGLKSALAATEA